MKSTRKWGVTQVLKEVIILKEITLKYLWYKRNVATTFTGPQMYFSFSLKLVLRKDKLVGKLAWALIFLEAPLLEGLIYYTGIPLFVGANSPAHILSEHLKVPWRFSLYKRKHYAK